MTTKPSKFDAGEFPLLREFARGYLHQDFRLEYESAIAAAQAYQNDLHVAERERLLHEASRMLRLAQSWTVSEARAAITMLGSPWKPDEAEDVLRLLRTLSEDSGYC